MKKRVLALLLAFVLVAGLLPTAAFAANGVHDVTVYAAVEGVTFADASGAAVSAPAAQDGDYTTYSLSVPDGVYTYTADGYGSGKLRVTDDGDVYLRVVNYTLNQKASCSFEMRVTNTEDTALVYASDYAADNKTTSLLIPALGFNVRYTYELLPEDEAYCPFSGDLWVMEGAKPFEGFKQSSYNLSDGNTFAIAKKAAVTLKIPTGASLRVEELVKFYRQPNYYETTFVKTEDGYDYYTATVAARANGSSFYYVVSKEGYMTFARIFKPYDGLEITVESLEQTPERQGGDYENSIITNGNASKFITMQTGEAFSMWSSRAWQAIDTITTNQYVEPDKHYTILEGDSVTVDEYGIVRAVKPGLSVVAITYDAMSFNGTNGTFYGAIQPERVAVFTFMVDGKSDGITTSLEKLSDLETFYFAKTLQLPGEEKKDMSDYMEYTIHPEATNGEALVVSTMNVYGYPTPKASGWTTCTPNADGSYTLKLYAGRTIVKFEAGDALRCHVLNAVGSDVTVTNVSTPDQPLAVGDIAKVSYSNVVTPLPKLGAIYNPGYPDTAYMEGTLLDADGNTMQALEGRHTQYGIGKESAVEASCTQAGTLTVSNLRIHLGAFGETATAHYILNAQSSGGLYTGDDAPESTGYYCYFQDISLTVADSDNRTLAAEVVKKINAIGTVELTAACKERIDAARNAYNNAVEQVKNLITDEQLQILLDAENAYTALADKKMAETIDKVTVDGVEYYVLRNAAELIWFAKLVNGTIVDVRQNANANALLGADITLNENLLDENGNVKDLTNVTVWTPMDKFGGIFDGCGYSISGLYAENTKAQKKLAFGFVATNNGTVQNLQFKDSALVNEFLAAKVGGVVGTNSKTGVVNNVVYHGAVRGGMFVGGIVGQNSGKISNSVFGGNAATAPAAAGGVGGICATNTGTVTQCVNMGEIEATGTATASGIVGSSGTGRIENCYSLGTLEAVKTVAGIAGLSGNANTVKNCYAAGTMTVNAGGQIFPIANTKAKPDGASYYLDTLTPSVANASYVAKSAAEFADGTVLKLLGEPYVQNIGTDPYPVFETTYVRVDEVEDLIDAIGEVDARSGDAIAAARDAYDALTNVQKELLDDGYYEKLEAAEEAYARILAEVEHVEDLIDAIGKVTERSGDAIKAARDAYDTLTDAQKELLGEGYYEKLWAAEKEYTRILGIILDTADDDVPDASGVFDDVFARDWFADAVSYVVDAGLMNGTSATTFSPRADTTRGMIVTILARLDGERTGGSPWYAAGRDWAMRNGISDGTNMEGKITREQLAAMLYRYADKAGFDISAFASLDGYADASSVSGWAKEAMQWAVGAGLINGRTATTLAPQGNATRAEVASILMRFMQKYTK